MDDVRSELLTIVDDIDVSEDYADDDDLLESTIGDGSLNDDDYDDDERERSDDHWIPGNMFHHLDSLSDLTWIKSLIIRRGMVRIIEEVEEQKRGGTEEKN